MCQDCVRIVSGWCYDCARIMKKLKRGLLSRTMDTLNQCVQTNNKIQSLPDFMNLLLDWGNLEFGNHWILFWWYGPNFIETWRQNPHNLLMHVYYSIKPNHREATVDNPSLVGKTPNVGDQNTDVWESLRWVYWCPSC